MSSSASEMSAAAEAVSRNQYSLIRHVTCEWVNDDMTGPRDVERVQLFPRMPVDELQDPRSRRNISVESRRPRSMRQRLVARKSMMGIEAVFLDLVFNEQ